MRGIRVVLIGVAALSIGVAAEATSLFSSGGPAEKPPASFKGLEYVDSHGCAFIRSGYGGAVTWVPRVHRSRQLVCGMTPTFATNKASPRKAAPIRAAAAPVQIQPQIQPPTPKRLTYTQKPRLVAPSAGPAQTVLAPRPKMGSTAPVIQKTRRQFSLLAYLGLKPKAGPVRSKPAYVPSPAPAPTVFTAPPKVIAAPAPRKPRQRFSLLAYLGFDRRARAVPAPAPIVVAPVPPIVVVAAAPRPSKPLFVNGPVFANGGWVRGGPQAIHPGDYYNGRLGQNRIASEPGVAQVVEATRTREVIPEGYKSLLAAGYGDSMSGVGTAAGRVAMDLIWTETVPRRLINPTAGRGSIARALVPVRYQYVTASIAPEIAVRQVERKQRKPRYVRPARDEAAPSNMILFRKMSDVSASDSSVVRMGTSSLVAKIRPVASIARQYVQVATFGVPENARRTLARFRVSGLPAVKRPIRLRGKAYNVVLLGPFDTEPALQSALSRARGAGFSDAFYVR